MGMNLLEVIGVSAKYDDSETILNGVNFSLGQHENLAIIGETGSGKSTLLKIIGGLVQPETGSVLFKNERVKGPEEKLIPGHDDILYLSQHFELPKFVKVEETLQNPYRLSEEQADEICQACDIALLLKKDTRHLSGGEKQRVALAKLLFLLPDLLLLDEPFSNLDVIHKRAMKAVVDKINSQLDTTCILVSHDPLDILSWAGKVIVLKSGTEVQMGTAKELYEQPRNTYVAGLFGAYSLIDPLEWNLDATGKCILEGHVMVRPERFCVSKENVEAIKGKVIKTRYLGSHDELEVEIFEKVVHVRALVGEYNVEDTVYVSYR